MKTRKPRLYKVVHFYKQVCVFRGKDNTYFFTVFGTLLYGIPTYRECKEIITRLTTPSYR